MSSIMLLAVIYFVGAVNLGFAQPGQDTSTRAYKTCDQLPKVAFFSKQATIRITSFTLTHSIGTAFNCTKILYVKPLSPDVDFSTVVSSQQTTVNFFDIKLSDGGQTVQFTRCATGVKVTFHTYRSRLESDIDGYFCLFACSSDGMSLERFYCASAGNSVNPQIPKVIQDLKKTIPGAEAINDATSGCPPPPFCTFLP